MLPQEKQRMSITRLLPTAGLIGVTALIVTPLAIVLSNMTAPASRMTGTQQKQSKVTKATEVAGFDGTRAYTYLTEQCELGPRISGSEANRSLRDRIAQHFADQGGEVKRQPFNARHPVTKEIVEMENIV